MSDFDRWKRKVYALAKKQKKSYLIPTVNDLDCLWRAGWTPEKVVEKHCTPEASYYRHYRDG